ncbi:MAG: proton-conducting transporter membrane subunit [Omnitrophica WOR_2 bacterium]
MNAPLFWIVFPGLSAAVLFIFRRWQRWITLIGIGLSLLLSWMAWRLPIDELISLGPWSLRISTTLMVLGRQFVLTATDQPLLRLIYILAAFWLAGSYLAKPGDMFVPLSLGIVSLMIAALAVEPFLYAALLIEMAALLCIPLLSIQGKPVGRGVLRFLTYQTLGTPFILFSGWALTSIETAPGVDTPAYRAAILLAIGFSFLLAIFPLNTWIPLLAEEAHPYAVAFVLLMLPGIATMFGLNFIQRYTWLHDSPNVYSILRLAGVIMIVTSGISAAFQRHLGRILAHAVILDIGLSLLAAGCFGSPSSNNLPAGSVGISQTGIFSALFFARGLVLGAWALALSKVRNETKELSFRSVQGLGRRFPITAAAILLANFSIGGFPLLVGFPIRLIVWQQIAQIAPVFGLWALIGSVGLLTGGLRTLAVFVMGNEEQSWTVTERGGFLIFLVLEVFTMIGLGLFPML